jgi:hypothetical protein
MTLSLLFLFAALACILGVVGSLALGLFAMTKTEQKDRLTSNKMMRMRVLFQGLTILFLLLSYLAK